MNKIKQEFDEVIENLVLGGMEAVDIVYAIRETCRRAGLAQSEYPSQSTIYQRIAAIKARM